MNRDMRAFVPGVSFRVSAWEAGKDVRAFLRGRGFSRRLVRQLAETGGVRVDDRPWTPGGRPFVLASGQRVEVVFPPPPERRVEPVSRPVTVAYEDADVLVVDKPPGLLVHPLPWERGDSLLARVYAYLVSTRGPAWYPHLVHRLDRPTSGLVLVALHPWAKYALSRALAAGRVRRVYAALLAGDLPADAGTIEGGIRRREDSLLVREVHPQGRPAQTSFRVVRRCGRATWVRAVLGSGRTHQIRVHFSSLGHPVLGDSLYGEAMEAEGTASSPRISGTKGRGEGPRDPFASPCTQRSSAFPTSADGGNTRSCRRCRAICAPSGRKSAGTCPRRGRVVRERRGNGDAASLFLRRWTVPRGGASRPCGRGRGDRGGRRNPTSRRGLGNFRSGRTRVFGEAFRAEGTPGRRGGAAYPPGRRESRARRRGRDGGDPHRRRHTRGNSPPSRARRLPCGGHRALSGEEPPCGGQSKGEVNSVPAPTAGRVRAWSTN